MHGRWGGFSPRLTSRSCAQCLPASQQQRGRSSRALDKQMSLERRRKSASRESHRGQRRRASRLWTQFAGHPPRNRVVEDRRQQTLGLQRQLHIRGMTRAGDENDEWFRVGHGPHCHVAQGAAVEACLGIRARDKFSAQRVGLSETVLSWSVRGYSAYNSYILESPTTIAEAGYFIVVPVRGS